MIFRLRITNTRLVAFVVGVFILGTLGWLAVRHSRPKSPLAEGAWAPGVSLALARDRAARVASVRYDLSLTIPANRTERLRGREILRFELGDASRPVLLDFAQPRDRLLSLSVGGTPLSIAVTNGHIVLPAESLRRGENVIEVSFIAGDESLNRNDDYLYSLFVPARASLAFPCFDQPDLKARYTLTLDVPAAWEVVANGAEERRTVAGDRLVVHFAETEPLSTYLLGFAAGRFKVESAERGGRRFRMFHRETDALKVARNRDAIFDLHAAALDWLERYTGIPYRFGKFDFVLVPAFQFGGMEHAGAILYNASALLLDQTATQDQQLGRASTIAHETAHMWFGDLVTMKWFDDVWMKEVFANFMAAKIVNPAFPNINHELRFLLAHYPGAYNVDRTGWANPIRQRLDTLNEAGQLYGPIIYQKAPIVMRQLEAIVGEERFKDGLREYLRRYQFGNATWLDLIRLLETRVGGDLSGWSHAWVEEPGRPTIRTDLDTGANGRIARLALVQSDPQGRNLHWTQQLDVVLGYPGQDRKLSVRLEGPTAVVAEAKGLPLPLYVLPSGGGVGYGLFELDEASHRYLVAHLPDVEDALTRGSAWLTLWDAMLERQLPPDRLIDLALRALRREPDELNAQRILGYLLEAYWRFLSPTQRRTVTDPVEAALRHGVARAPTVSLKAAYFSAFRRAALSPDALSWLERIWRAEERIPGLTFSENDFSDMALELAVRQVPRWKAILERQLRRIENADRKPRFQFVMPALSADEATRDRFFESLADASNRRHEPWVLEGVAYLHHPLRANHAEQYIRPSLDLLADIQRTGDIFLPKRWMDATLDGHNSRAAAATVRQFLAEQSSYPRRLRHIILQSADGLFRASDIVERAKVNQP